MPYTVIIEENVNLENYPKVDKEHPLTDDTSITMGDLHGNTLKLIWTLIRQNALKLQPVGSLKTAEEVYKRLVEIYKKDAVQLTKQDLDDFNAIIRAAKIEKMAAVRIIGDELADRGQNDYFTLKMLEKLDLAGVRTEVLLSNHGAEFLDMYSRNTLRDPTKDEILGNVNAKSLHGLSTLINKGLVDEDEIKKIVELHYKPHLKAISYSVDRNEKPPKLTLYTHAPVGLETIKATAEYYKIKYDDSSIEALTKTIDQINECFYREICKGIIYPDREKFSNDVSFDALGMTAIPTTHPIWRLMWNRGAIDQDKGVDNADYGIKLPKEQHGYQLELVHGHDGPSDRLFQVNDTQPTKSFLPNMRNTDNDLGKKELTGNYHIVSSNDQIALTPNPALKNSALVPIKIIDIYSRARQSFKIPIDDDILHQEFIESKLNEMASKDGKDLKIKVYREMYERTFGYLYSNICERNQGETLVDYSKRLAKKSNLYQSKFLEFHKEKITQQDTLRQIKTLIEDTDWQVGKWGSLSKIKVAGVTKPVPNHVYEIYKQCLQGEKSPETALQALEQIHKISSQAMEPKTILFKSFRQRHQATMESYKAIREQSEQLVSSIGSHEL